MKLMLIVVHVVVCAHFLAGSGAVDGSEGGGAGSRVSLHWLEYFLWLGHSAQSLELLLYHLDATKHSSETPMAQWFDSMYLMMCQAAHTARLIATFGWFDGIISSSDVTGMGAISFLINVLGSRLLTFAILPGIISCLLGLFLLFSRARIGTVIEIYWDVLFSHDNYAFVLLMLAFCVAFSGTISCINILNDIVDAPSPATAQAPSPAPAGPDVAVYMVQSYMAPIADAAGSFVSFQSTETLRYFAVALGVDEDSMGTKDQSVDARGVFWLFWLLANTYLVQGFLVGIISDNFINKQKAAEKVLLLQKLELIRCYITRQQGTLRYVERLPLPFNVLSLVTKFWCYTDLTEFTFMGIPVGKELQRTEVIMAGAELNLADDMGGGVRTTAAAFRVLFRIWFCLVLMCVLLCTGPTLLIHFLGGQCVIETPGSWTMADSKRRQGKEQEKTHQEEARLLEVAALNDWRDFRDDAWNDSSQDVKVSARFDKLEERFIEQERAMGNLQRSLDLLLSRKLKDDDRSSGGPNSPTQGGLPRSPASR